nr:class I SAM-dependent methyltransferase [Deinococcus reticulitermitis]
MPASLSALLARRAPLAAQGTTFYRAAHTTETDGRYALDVAGDAGVLSLYADLTPEEEQALAESCARAGELRSVYLKRRPPEARHLANVAREWLSPPQPVWGAPQPEVTVLEQGVPYLIRPGADLSLGLFADARPARAWVRAHAPERVLNTFAYTCGFGLSAALGGAEVVKNVDLSRRVLAWGRENYALSGLAAPEEDFLYGDVFGWLGRLHKRGDRFGLVILDPPGFARSRAGTWRADKDYGRLVRAAAGVTESGGQLLALLNHAGVSAASLEQLVGAGLEAAGRRGRLGARFGAGEDYPGATHLKVQVWTLD